MKILISQKYYGQYFRSLHSHFPCNKGRLLEVITSKKIDPIFTCHKMDKSLILEGLGVDSLSDDIRIYVINSDSVFYSSSSTKSESFIDHIDEMIKSYIQNKQFDIAICNYKVNTDNTINVSNHCEYDCMCPDNCSEYHLYVNGKLIETTYSYTPISNNSFVSEVSKLVKSSDSESEILRKKFKELRSMLENI